jgi:O-Antigen ligase
MPSHVTEHQGITHATPDSRWLAAAVFAAILIATAGLFGAWAPLVLACVSLAVVLALMVPTDFAVIPLLLTAILEAPISRLGLHLFSITIDPEDLGLVFAITYLIVLTASRRFQLRVPRGSSSVLLLIVMLAMPIVTGVAHGHYWQTSFAGGKVAFYYPCVYGCWLLIPSRRAANRILIVILGLALAAAAYLLIARVRGYQWESGMSGVPTTQGAVSRGYGMWSATPWYPIGCLIALAYAWLSHATVRRRVLALVAAAALLVATLSTLIRGDVVAISAGLLVLVLASLGPGRLAAAARSRIALTLCVVLMVLVCLAPILVHNSFVGLIIERTQSIVQPQASALKAANNREFRLNALSQGLRFASLHPLGYGYGSMAASPSSEEAQMQTWGYHNAIAWLGFNGGIVGLAGVCLAWLLICGEVVRRLRAEKDQRWGIVAVLAVLAFLTVESLDANGLFAARFAMGLAVVVLSLAFVYGDNLRQRR